MRYSVPCAVLYFCVFVVGTHGGQVSTGPLQTVLLDRAVSSQNHDSESELETVRCLCFHLFFSPTFFSPTNQTFVIVCNFCLKSTHNSTYMFLQGQNVNESLIHNLDSRSFDVPSVSASLEVPQWQPEGNSSVEIPQIFVSYIFS
jgi:hypothetical protein